MEHLFDIFKLPGGMTWSTLLFRALMLWLVYWLLARLQGRLQQGGLFGNYQDRLKRTVNVILVLYEPVAALVILGSALQLNSSMALLVLLLFLLAGYLRLRDYFYGILLRLDASFVVGRQLRSPAGNGTITRLRRLGARLQTRAGQQFVPYGHLYRDGYTLEGAEQSTNFVSLELFPMEEGSLIEAEYLLARLANLPYLDDRHQPEVQMSSSKKGQLDARLALRESDSVPELVALLEEWGYRYNILQK